MAVSSVLFVFALASVCFGAHATAATRWRRRRAIAPIVLGLMALLAVPWTAAVHGLTPPSDAALLKNFTEHEASFVAMAERLQTDDSVDQVQLRALGIGSLEHYSKDNFELWVAGFGIVPSGWGKGYVYSTQAPGLITNDLDHGAQADGITYRHIKGPWYLFYYVW